MSRPLLILLTLLVPIASPLASAAPVDDALAFQRAQTETTFDTVDAATREGFDSYFEAVDALNAAQTNVTNAGFDAFFATIDAAFATLAAATTDVFDGAATGSDGIWEASRHGSDGVFGGYEGALTAADAATRGAEAATYELTSGTGENAFALVESVQLPVDALGPFADATRSLTEQGFNEYFQAVDDAGAGVQATGEAGMTTYGSALDAASRTSRAAGDNAFTSYEETLAAADAVAFNATNTTFNGYFTTLSAFEDFTDSAGNAGFDVYFGAVSASDDAARSAVDTGFDAYFGAVDAGFGLARDTTDLAFDGYFDALRTSGGLLYSALVPCSYAEGGGYRVGGTGNCVGQGIFPNEPEYEEPAPGSSFGPSSASDGGPSTAESTPPMNPNSPPYNCQQTTPQQYGIRVYRQDGTASSKCAQVLTVAGGVPTPVNGNKDYVRLFQNDQSSTLTLEFSHMSGELRGFEIVLGRTVLLYEVGVPRDGQLIGSSVKFVLSGVRTTLFAGTAVDPTVKLHYEGGPGASVAKFKFTPSLQAPEIYYLVEAGRWVDGVNVGHGSTPTTIDLTASFANPSPGRAYLDVDLVLPPSYANNGLKVEVGNRGAPIRVMGDSVPAHIRLANGELRQKIEYGEAYDATFKGDLELYGGHIPNLYLPLAGIEAKLTDVTTLTDLEYRQVKVYYDGSSTLPCDQDVYEAIGDVAIGEEQICVTATPQQPDLGIELDGGSVTLNYLPAAPVQITFGPLGAIHYKELTSSADGGRARLNVEANPKFGDIRRAYLDNFHDLMFIPGTSLGGDESGECGGGGAPPLPGNDKRDMAFVARFTPGVGAADILVGAGENEVKVKLSSVTSISAVGVDFVLDFATSGGRIDALEATVVVKCKPAHLKVTPTSGVVKLRVATGDGKGDNDPYLFFDQIRLIHNAKVSFDVKGEIEGFGFHLYGHVKRHGSGDYYAQAELDIDGPAYGDEDGDDFGLNRGSDHFTYTWRNPDNWFKKLYVVTFKLEPGAA